MNSKTNLTTMDKQPLLPYPIFLTHQDLVDLRKSIQALEMTDVWYGRDTGIARWVLQTNDEREILLPFDETRCAWVENELDNWSLYCILMANLGRDSMEY